MTKTRGNIEPHSYANYIITTTQSLFDSLVLKSLEILARLVGVGGVSDVQNHRHVYGMLLPRECFYRAMAS